MAKHRTLIQLEDEQWERLRELAFQRRVSLSELLRQIVGAWLQNTDGKGKRK